MGDLTLNNATNVFDYLKARYPALDIGNMTRARCIRCRQPMGHRYWILDLPLDQLFAVIIEHLKTKKKVCMYCCKCANLLKKKGEVDIKRYGINVEV